MSKCVDATGSKQDKLGRRRKTIMTDLDHLNVHSVEFEAPLSSESLAGTKKHFSIDLSLELERQLDMESFPPTPVHYVDGKPVTGIKSPRDSMDPQILAHIVKQLQQSLVDVTRERDELREAVALSHSHEAEIQDALQHMIDKATTMEIELSDARKKIKDDEEAIALLRTKVEESRRGLMRLQTENRRQSMAPIDVSRAGIPSFNSPPSAKRATFTPMTGSLTARPGHRRIASVSSVNDSPTHPSFLDNKNSTSPPSFTFPDNVSSLPPNNSRRYSGLFGRTSPNSQTETTTSTSPEPSFTAELEALRKELRTVKDQLTQTKHELMESNEAREASETCVKALRDFIGENDVGATITDPETASVTSLKLPPPPTMARGDDDESVIAPPKKTAPATSWGFGKLWGESTAKAPPSVPLSATIAPAQATPTQPPPPMSATPLSRKFGSFFSSRTPSISSTASVLEPAPEGSTSGSRLVEEEEQEAKPRLSNAGESIQESIRESMYGGSTSDSSSSDVEPVSPPEVYNTDNVVVRDGASLSDSSASNSPELGKDIKMESTRRFRGIVSQDA
ncbi:hypothetical protein H0H92_010019 [Tricholoma furcatifolium]|nr:hypothetical protein H0H92_010019 [Tricholoma furcatifolium]